MRRVRLSLLFEEFSRGGGIHYQGAEDLRFGFPSVLGCRTSDFRPAVSRLAATGGTLEQPWCNARAACRAEVEVE